MALSEEIRKQIREYSYANKQEDLIEYLKDKIKKNEIQIHELFDYARDYIFVQLEGKPHIINAAVINKIGVFISSLDDDQSKLSVQFYKLAAAP